MQSLKFYLCTMKDESAEGARGVLSRCLLGALRLLCRETFDQTAKTVFASLLDEVAFIMSLVK